MKVDFPSDRWWRHLSNTNFASLSHTFCIALAVGERQFAIATGAAILGAFTQRNHRIDIHFVLTVEN